jgi:hypothetical protein
LPMATRKRRKAVHLGAALIVLTLCVSGQVARSGAADAMKCDGTSLANPTCWHKLDAGPFSILAPSGWEFHQLRGVDSYVGEFVGDGVALTFDFGGYPSGYLEKAKKPAYIIAKKSIGGFSAKVVSPRTAGKGITGVYFRKLRGNDTLFLFGKDLTSAQKELVLKIFETIRFGDPVPPIVIPPPPPYIADVTSPLHAI